MLTSFSLLQKVLCDIKSKALLKSKEKIPTKLAIPSSPFKIVVNTGKFEPIDQSFKSLMMTAVKEIGRSWVQLVNGHSFGVCHLLRGWYFILSQRAVKHIGNNRGKIMGKFSKTESQYGSSSGSQADLLSLERKFVTLMLINLRIRFEQIALVLKTIVPLG